LFAHVWDRRIGIWKMLPLEIGHQHNQLVTLIRIAFVVQDEHNLIFPILCAHGAGVGALSEGLQVALLVQPAFQPYSGMNADGSVLKVWPRGG
jgi:hypothetical protein